MPGIFGVINSPLAESLCGGMRAGIGPDTTRHRGVEVFPRFSAAAGWCCHPGAFSDCMPAWNRAHDLCIVFWGEHFDTGAFGRAIRRPVMNATDLVDAYEKLGDGMFEDLNGTFCGLVLDMRPGRERAVLFNDRYGLGRLYYHQTSTGEFFFAAEAKALLSVMPQLRTINQKALGEFLSCGCVLDDDTLYSGVSLLPGGSAWEFRPDGRVDRRRYFDRSTWETEDQVGLDEYAKRMDETLMRVVPRYFGGRRPIALSITGGVDSRMIMAAVDETAKFPCYTFGGLYRECADVRIGRAIATACGHSHQVISLTPEFFAEFPALAREAVVRTDGCMDVSGAAGLFVNHRARSVAPIRMTGNYGGEILRGLIAFKPQLGATTAYSDDIQPLLQKAAQNYHEHSRARRASFIAFKQVPWHHYSRYCLEESKLTIRTPYLDNELVKLSYAAPPVAYVDKAPAFDFIRRRRSVLHQIPTDRGVTARFTFLPLRARRALTEFMPLAEYTYDYGMPHWLSKVDRFTAPLHIERLFLGRQKYFHYRIWYRHELSSFVRAMLLDPLTLSRPYLNRRVVENLVTAHVNGTGNHTTTIHQLLTTEMIHRYVLKAS